ncbi:unnamed protein product [Brachionus calyciflorus]|uniref:Uncharacterized protein n=1 Tax=Brachionus calyciflorus TaxID=104777 RepID=A0A813UXX3_9BILA|nr:unnamed protein product [Brachionus calyciflorus]
MKFVFVYFVFLCSSVSSLKLYQNYICPREANKTFCISYQNSIMFEDQLKHTFIEYHSRVGFVIYNFRLHNFKINEYGSELKLDFLAGSTKLIDISFSNLNYLINVLDYVHLANYSIRFSHLEKLEDFQILSDSIETFDFSNNKIKFVQENFFRKFRYLQAVNLKNNQIFEIKRLEFNSKYLRYLNFKNIQATKIDEIYFVNNPDDLWISFDQNRLDSFPKINGKIKKIKNYVIGLQSKKNLLYNKTLQPSDNPINIINLEINHDHFIRENISDSLSCLLNHGTILNIVLRGKLSFTERFQSFFFPNYYKLENLYKMHVKKDVFDLNKCKDYVIMSSVTTTTTHLPTVVSTNFTTHLPRVISTDCIAFNESISNENSSNITNEIENFNVTLLPIDINEFNASYSENSTIEANETIYENITDTTEEFSQGQIDEITTVDSGFFNKAKIINFLKDTKLFFERFLKLMSENIRKIFVISSVFLVMFFIVLLIVYLKKAGLA